MFDRDQSGRTGGPDEEGDETRTDRLKEILAEYGCGANGKPKPATPLAEPDRIDELREEAGLPPYDEYLAEMEQICAEVR